jgi:hypothetical protein
MAVLSQAAAGEDIAKINYMPPLGVVHDEKIAIALAKTVLSSVYGHAQIKKQLPLKAHLGSGEVWLVSGSFNGPANSEGGVVKILIRKKDGAVLGMIHEK